MFFLAPFRAIYRHRRILWSTTMTDLRGLYAGSIFGMAWVFIGPILMLAVYALIYAVIFRVRPAQMDVEEYVLYVFCGLVPFLTFASSLIAGAGSLAANRHLLLNTVFPAELIPVRNVLVATAAMPGSVIIIFVSQTLLGNLSLKFLIVSLVMMFELMFVIGLSWILALVMLLLRDIQQILAYLIMILLVITPIAYTPDMVPAQLKLLIYFNPLFYYVISFQSLVILDKFPPPDVVAIGTINSLMLFCCGYWTCTRARQAFYDYA
jgi:lipopolysaccharide transport system permease protein